MKTNTFKHLENLCAVKGIVCERRGRKIELTTPGGGTTAECESLAEALDTYRTDPAFSTLPVRIQAPAKRITADAVSAWLELRVKEFDATYNHAYFGSLNYSPYALGVLESVVEGILNSPEAREKFRAQVLALA